MAPSVRNIQQETVAGDTTSAIDDVAENAAETSLENEREQPRKRVRVLQYSRSDLLI